LGALRASVLARLGQSAEADARRTSLDEAIARKERARREVRASLRSGALSAAEAEPDLLQLAAELAELQREREVLQVQDEVAEAEEARLVAVSATFDDVADEWRAAVAADDRLTLRRVISRLVRRIEVTPIERDGRRTSEVAIIFAFEPESSVRPLLAYASAYVRAKNTRSPG
ncbi:MAG: hypothetical protein JOZ65_07800, partial [Chloroflexi bacterium]|nr:hypothetical protein [Chloroflexota bacterium]